MQNCKTHLWFGFAKVRDDRKKKICYFGRLDVLEDENVAQPYKDFILSFNVTLGA